MLCCKGCRVRAGHFHLVIDRFRLARGEHCLIIGPSGAGKSLFLRAIAGLAPLDQGTILLRDSEATDLPPEYRRIGLVFQHYSLFPHLSVIENVAFGLRMRGVGKKERQVEAEAVLERLGCGALRNRRPGTLSGGEQQRVAIARALAAGADLLLLDEPFAALDPTTRALCRAELRQFRNTLDLTVLEVTHAADEASAGADRAIILDGGEIVADGVYADLTERPPTLRAARAIGVPNLVRTSLVDPGEEGWCTVSPSHVSITLADTPPSSDEIGLAGIVETTEPLGPIARVRLRVGGPGGPAVLTGFLHSESGPRPVPGALVRAVFPRSAVRRFP